MSQLNGLLIWSDPKDWNAAVHRFLDDCITKDIRSQVVKNPEMDCTPMIGQKGLGEIGGVGH